MTNDVEEVFVLLFPRRITNTCFGSIVLRVSKVRLFKDSIGLLAHDKKNQKKNWRKNVSTKMFRVYMGFKVWEYHLSTNAVRRQYYPVWKLKIYYTEITPKSHRFEHIYISTFAYLVPVHIYQVIPRTNYYKRLVSNLPQCLLDISFVKHQHLVTKLARHLNLPIFLNNLHRLLSA